jgi:hypothetical protein
MEDEHDGDSDDGNDHHNGFDKDENHLGYHRDGKRCNDRKCITADQFRIVITDGLGNLIYDNQINMALDGFAATAISRGAIEVNDTKLTKKISGVKASAEDKVLESTLYLYPNPTNTQFTLFLDGNSKDKIEVDMFDMLGKYIKHIESNDGQIIDFGQDLPTGAYFTTITQGTYQKKVRLIKQ